MACGISDPLGCVGTLVGSVAGSAWDGICESFATAADWLLKQFAHVFTAIPPVDLASPGVKNVYALCVAIAAVITVLLVLSQVIRTALTHDGTALATALTGILKAAAAFMLTLVIASAAITAADALTSWIISQTFGSAAGLTGKITTLISFSGPNEAVLGASMILILAITGILLILVLWFELLLRNAALAVLVATSPIAAAGLVSQATRSWWPKLASATIQLIIVKPVIALVFALGFELTGSSQDIETLLAGMLILLLAVVAWPAIAVFLPFTSISSGTAGLGMLLGFAAGRLSAPGGPPAGVPPGQFSRAAEASVPSGAAASAGGAGLAIAAASARAAQRAITALTGQMDQVAGHAGLSSGGAAVSPSHGGRRGRNPSARADAPGTGPGLTRRAAPPPGPRAGAGHDPGGWSAGEPAAGPAHDWPDHYPDEDPRLGTPGPSAGPAPDWPEHYPEERPDAEPPQGTPDPGAGAGPAADWLERYQSGRPEADPPAGPPAPPAGSPAAAGQPPAADPRPLRRPRPGPPRPDVPEEGQS